MEVTEDILRHSAVPNLDMLLGNLSWRELQAALIYDSARRAGGLAVHQVMQQYQTNPFIKPSELDQRQVLKFSAYIADILPADFDMVELSPVTAFGSNSVLSSISQKTVLTTTRGTEVIADGVTALTLEAAKRRDTEGQDSPFRLATLHRELRTQKHEQPGFTPHFHALSLVSGERTSQPEEFKAKAFSDHLKIYLDVMHKAASIGYDVSLGRVV